VSCAMCASLETQESTIPIAVAVACHCPSRSRSVAKLPGEHPMSDCCNVSPADNFRAQRMRAASEGGRGAQPVLRSGCNTMHDSTTRTMSAMRRFVNLGIWSPPGQSIEQTPHVAYSWRHGAQCLPQSNIAQPIRRARTRPRAFNDMQKLHVVGQHRREHMQAHATASREQHCMCPSTVPTKGFQPIDLAPRSTVSSRSAMLSKQAVLFGNPQAQSHLDLVGSSSSPSPSPTSSTSRYSAAGTSPCFRRSAKEVLAPQREVSAAQSTPIQQVAEMVESQEVGEEDMKTLVVVTSSMYAATRSRCSQEMPAATTKALSSPCFSVHANASPFTLDLENTPMAFDRTTGQSVELSMEMSPGPASWEARRQAQTSDRCLRSFPLSAAAAEVRPKRNGRAQSTPAPCETRGHVGLIMERCKSGISFPDGGNISTSTAIASAVLAGARRKSSVKIPQGAHILPFNYNEKDPRYQHISRTETIATPALLRPKFEEHAKLVAKKAFEAREREGWSFGCGILF